MVNSAKRILIFSTAYLPMVGGAEIAIKEITDRISDTEFDLICARIDPSLAAVERTGKVTVYRLGYGTKFDKFLLPILGTRKARELIQKNTYDRLWSVMAGQASVACAFTKKLFPQIPLVLTLQEGDEEEYLARYVGGNMFLYWLLIRPWHLLVFKRADQITVISEYLKKRAESNGVRVPITLVPNGVDTEKFSMINFQFSNEDRNALRASLRFSETDTVLVTTSRLVEKNAVDDIIKALVLLPETVKLLVIGAGPLEASLKAVAHGYQLQGRVVFQGFVPQAEIPKYLKASDIFVRPSLSEGFGNSFIEAMVVGIPVIATPVGGITDFLVDRSTGLFCLTKDPKSIADKVTLLMNDKKLREHLVETARSMAVAKYDWSGIASMMREVFQK
ncbi:glycosyltransferase family 1 protein [Patescibacteria group bacterium]|nr:MAG: glycosyltransferase family 1 protein [Patescibacteria group bacterium]